MRPSKRFVLLTAAAVAGVSSFVHAQTTSFSGDVFYQFPLTPASPRGYDKNVRPQVPAGALERF